MTSVTAARSRALLARPRPAAAVVTAVAVLVAVGAAGAVVLRPVVVLIALGALAVVAAMVLRVEWAALAFVAVEPFEGYVKGLSGSGVKLVGALLFTAWVVRLLTRSRPVRLAHAATYSAAAFTLVLLAAAALHPNGTDGLAVVGRYLSFLAALVVLVDCMRTTLPVRTVAAVFVTSCTAAAVVALIGYLTGPVGGRAGGPVGDPNDFAFYLITAIPLALALWRRRTRWRACWPVAATVLTITTALTYSRGALLGLLVMALFALLTGQVRARAAVTVGVVVVLLGAAAWAVAPQTIARSLSDKSDVAQQNVDDRFTTWTIAAGMTAASPLLGVGPGGFRADYERYRPAGSAQTPNLDVVHDMYLEVSAELGLLGLAAFVIMLGAGFAGAWRRAGRDPTSLGAGVCNAFVGTLAAAAFLTEQYFLPVWLLVALGVALDPRAKGR